MSKLLTEYIQHVITEIEFLYRESENITEEQFMHDEVKMRAFARSLEIIGEAVKMIPENFRSSHSDINWKSFAGLRDKLIHHYFGVDYAIVWDVVKNELPTLYQHLITVITSEKK